MANSVALLFVTAALLFLALALLWRVGSWNLSPASVLTHDEGLRIGSEAPQLSAHREKEDYHLDFVGRTSLVVFGTEGCKPCYQLLAAATQHPATRHVRLVYVTDEEPSSLDEEFGFPHWEIYRYHDETKARDMWRAPVSPYFHFISSNGSVLAKGVANAPEHLDRLLQIGPLGSYSTTVAG